MVEGGVHVLSLSQIRFCIHREFTCRVRTELFNCAQVSLYAITWSANATTKRNLLRGRVFFFHLPMAFLARFIVQPKLCHPRGHRSSPSPAPCQHPSLHTTHRTQIRREGIHIGRQYLSFIQTSRDSCDLHVRTAGGIPRGITKFIWQRPHITEGAS